MNYIHICTMTGYAGSRDFVGSPQSPQKTPHRSTHPTEKQTPTLSQEIFAGFELFEVTRTELLREGRSLFFSVMCGYVWGLLRGPYVISRPGVPSHIYNVFQKDKMFDPWWQLLTAHLNPLMDLMVRLE